MDRDRRSAGSAPTAFRGVAARVSCAPWSTGVDCPLDPARAVRELTGVSLSDVQENPELLRTRAAELKKLTGL